LLCGDDMYFVSKYAVTFSGPVFLKCGDDMYFVSKYGVVFSGPVFSKYNILFSYLFSPASLSSIYPRPPVFIFSVGSNHRCVQCLDIV